MKDDSAFWANLVIAHVWGAAAWVKPGGYATAGCLLSLLVAVAIYASEKIEKAKKSAQMLKEREQ